MRILFISGGSAGAVFPLVPLALEARNHGHDVLMAATSAAVPLVTAAGLPAYCVSDTAMLDFMRLDHNGERHEIPSDPHERNIFNGRGMARLAVATREGLGPLLGSWRPDVIVGGKLSYAAPVLAGEHGIPWVRHALNMGEPPIIDRAAQVELSPLMEEIGIAELPEPIMFVDTCPPSVRRDDAGPAQAMRYVPFNTQKPVEPWMLAKQDDRPRLYVSAGSRVTRDYEFSTLTDLVEKIAPMDVEVLLAAPETVTEALGTLPANVRAGWLPLDVLVSSCDLLVHHAGGNTMLAGVVTGVPQLLMPQMPKQVPPARRLAEHGSSLALMPGEDGAEEVAASIKQLLADSSYRRRAALLRDEAATMPAPSTVMTTLETALRAAA